MGSAIDSNVRDHIAERFFRSLTQDSQNMLLKAIDEEPGKVVQYIRAHLTEFSMSAVVHLGDIVYIGDVLEASKEIVEQIKKSFGTKS